ncbi:hypothetical protein [Geodermatophilus sp. URMC 64]
MVASFRTFCHVSEYGVEGYANLHRMIAVSSPLVLWAPSSAFLAQPSCRVPPHDFLDYVDRGLIKVIGREHWLLGREQRRDASWVGASWDDYLDKALRTMAVGDQFCPVSERRVIIAEPEGGKEFAERELEENGRLVELITAMVTDAERRAEIPVGVLEAADKLTGRPDTLAFQVLRDAYNHVNAVAEAQSQAPFLLQPRESRFVTLMAELTQDRLGSAIPRTPSIGRTLSDAELAEFTREILRLLEHLDAARRTSLRDFMDGEGHRQLAGWVGEIFAELVAVGATDVRGAVLRRVQHDFDKGELQDGPPGALRRALEVAGRASFVGGVGEVLATGQLSALGALGLLVGLFQEVGAPIAERLGFVPASYTGEQWPFLYTFGKPASGRGHAEMRSVLDSLVPD